MGNVLLIELTQICTLPEQPGEISRTRKITLPNVVMDDVRDVCASSRYVGVAKSEENISKVIDFRLQSVDPVLERGRPSQIARRVVDTVGPAFLLAGGTCGSVPVALSRSALGPCAGQTLSSNMKYLAFALLARLAGNRRHLRALARLSWSSSSSTCSPSRGVSIDALVVGAFGARRWQQQVTFPLWLVVLIHRLRKGIAIK